jgi:anaerobic selenocysteine-containing dehydrogenase
MRSNDQFNTTIYGFSERLRGLAGSRMVLLINPDDMARADLRAEDVDGLISDAGDNKSRTVSGLSVTPFDLPDGCVGGYYPEMNALIPLWLHDKAPKTPASKGGSGPHRR